jgi:hypothetical protein
MIYHNIELHNIADIEETGAGLRLSRLPAEVREQVESGTAQVSWDGAGTELRFVIKSGKARVLLRRAKGGAYDTGIGEVYYGSFQASWQLSPFFVTGAGSEICIPPVKDLSLLKEISQREAFPYSPELVRVILPYDAGNLLVDVEGDLAPPDAGMVPRKRYLAYGSSITHGGSAIRPTGTYAMELAGKFRRDLINLGMAGNARMEGVLGEYIARRDDWDIATLEMGINVIDQWDTETFRTRLDDFMEPLVKYLGNRQVFCIDQFLNKHYWENESRDMAEKLRVYKQIVREKVRQINLPNLHYIGGETLLPRWQNLSADLVHPAEAGLGAIADNLFKFCAPFLKE